MMPLEYWRKTNSRLISRRSHTFRASKHVQELTPTDSKSSRTLIAMGSMSLWVGENLTRRMWEG